MYLHLRLKGEPVVWYPDNLPTESEAYLCFCIRGAEGFINAGWHNWDDPTSIAYDPARCGAFADWLEENKDRLLEPHTDLRAEAEERLDSLIQWLRSGFQITA